MYIFYYVYLEILRFKICIENCAKSKWEEQKETEGIATFNEYHANLIKSIKFIKSHNTN